MLFSFLLVFFYVWYDECATSTHSKYSGVASYLSQDRVDKIDPEALIDPEAMSHILMVLSQEPLTRMLGLSGLKAMQLTPLLLKHTKLVLKT